MVDVEDRYHAIPAYGDESQDSQPITSRRWLGLSVALYALFGPCLVLAFLVATSICALAPQSTSAAEPTSLFGIFNNLKVRPNLVPRTELGNPLRANLRGAAYSAHIPQVAQRPNFVSRREMGIPLRGGSYVPAAHTSESATVPEEAEPSGGEDVPGNLHAVQFMSEALSGWEVIPGSMVLPVMPPSTPSQSLDASQDLQKRAIAALGYNAGFAKYFLR